MFFEFNILFKLLSYPKKTFTRAQLMAELARLEHARFLYWLGLPLILLLPVTFFLTV